METQLNNLMKLEIYKKSMKKNYMQYSDFQYLYLGYYSDTVISFIDNEVSINISILLNVSDQMNL